MKYVIFLFCCLCYTTFGYAQAPVFGVVLNDRENPFFNKILEGVYQSAANAGVDESRIRVVDSQYDVQMQIQQLKQLQFEGVEAIIQMREGETVSRYNLIESELVTRKII